MKKVRFLFSELIPNTHESTKGMGSAGEAIGTSVSKAKDRVSQTVGQSVKGLKDTDIVKGVETTVRTTSKAIKTTSEVIFRTKEQCTG